MNNNSACNCSGNCNCKSETESYVGGNPFPTSSNGYPLEGTLTGNAAITTTGTSSSAMFNTTTNWDLNGLANTTANLNPYYPKELKDVIVTPETIEIIYVKRAMYTYTQSTFTIGGNYQSYTPDITFKEIYGCKDGALTLIKTVYGRVIPPREVPETFEFDE